MWCFFSDNLFQALENFLKYQELSLTQKHWTKPDGVSHLEDSVIHLIRIYSKIGAQCVGDGNIEDSLEYYRRAYMAAKNGIISMLF